MLPKKLKRLNNNSEERGGGLEMSFAGGRLTQNCKKIFKISTCVYIISTS